MSGGVCQWKPFWILVGDTFNKSYIEEWLYVADEMKEWVTKRKTRCGTSGTGTSSYYITMGQCGGTIEWNDEFHYQTCQTCNTFRGSMMHVCKHRLQSVEDGLSVSRLEKRCVTHKVSSVLRERGNKEQRNDTTYDVSQKLITFLTCLYTNISDSFAVLNNSENCEHDRCTHSSALPSHGCSHVNTSSHSLSSHSNVLCRHCVSIRQQWLGVEDILHIASSESKGSGL